MSITRLSPTDTGACGTARGHERHRRRREVSCRPCLDAANTEKADRVRSRRTSTATAVQRREQAALVPLPVRLGALAGTNVPHPFAGMDMSQCGECFGWRDDHRHPVLGGPVVGR